MTGTLHIVGIGPGGADHRTPAATRAIAGAGVVCGYGPYVDACADAIAPGATVLRGAMGEESERAADAIDRAAAGARVALVSSGDPGVHGMAARTLARAAEVAPGVRVEVVPGVTAALASAALVGAPLADDFAVLSLSDVRVEWSRVEARLRACAAAGLALALYNPRSKARPDALARALEVVAETRPADTPVAFVTDAARPGESTHRTTLADADPTRVGMTTLVLVAGDTGTLAGPWLVAQRDTTPPHLETCTSGYPPSVPTGARSAITPCRAAGEEASWR